MRQYLDLLKDVMENGVKKEDRTGTGTISVFGRQTRYDLSKGFPLLTTKKMFTKAIIHELLWFLKGDSNIKYLVDNDVKIWNEWPFRAYLQKTGQPVPPTGGEEWNAGIATFVEKVKTDGAFAKEYGELGPVYGYQWRSWPRRHGKRSTRSPSSWPTLKGNPDSRRHIVTAWNPLPISHEMALCRRATASSSSTWRKRPALMPALPALGGLCSSACRSISPPTRSSR
jgi:thymidylate synthase